jgi:hypothetical protein
MQVLKLRDYYDSLKNYKTKSSELKYEIISYEDVDKKIKFNCKDDKTFYYDYINLHELLESTYPKYPKHLKSMHDILTYKYNLVKKEINIKIFKKVVQDYKYLECMIDDYYFMIPNNTEDLFDEGKKLHHCVASYIDSIMQRLTFILFMRKHKYEPLITIELKDNMISQVKHKNNYKLNSVDNEEEINAINKFCHQYNLRLYKNVFL